MLPPFPHEKLLVPSLGEFVGKGPDSLRVVRGSEQLLQGRSPHLGYRLGRSDVDLFCVSVRAPKEPSGSDRAASLTFVPGLSVDSG